MKPVLVDALQRLMNVLMPDSVLAPLSSRVGLSAVSVSEPGVNSNPHSMTRVALTELPQHVRGACIHRNVVLDNELEHFIGYDVRGVHHARGLTIPEISCRKSSLQFTSRYGVNQDALGPHQAENVNVRVCLLSKSDDVESPERGDPVSDDGGVVYVYGGAPFASDPVDQGPIHNLLRASSPLKSRVPRASVLSSAKPLLLGWQHH